MNYHITKILKNHLGLAFIFGYIIAISVAVGIIFNTCDEMDCLDALAVPLWPWPFWLSPFGPLLNWIIFPLLNIAIVYLTGAGIQKFISKKSPNTPNI